MLLRTKFKRAAVPRVGGEKMKLPLFRMGRGHRGTEADEREGGGDRAFARLVEESKHQLYPGNKHVGRFSFVLKLLHHKSYYRISNRAFDAMLTLLADSYPDGNTLPRSYREAKDFLKELGLSYDSIHVCPNNCILFRKEHAGKVSKKFPFLFEIF